MKEPVCILPEIALLLHKILISDHGGLACAYYHGIARNHPIVDRNKRSALTLVGVFLDINGSSPEATEAEAVVIIEQLAAGKIRETDLAAWFKINNKKIED